MGYQIHVVCLNRIGVDLIWGIPAGVHGMVIILGIDDHHLHILVKTGAEIYSNFRNSEIIHGPFYFGSGPFFLSQF